MEDLGVMIQRLWRDGQRAERRRAVTPQTTVITEGGPAPVRVPAGCYEEAFRKVDVALACPECWEQYRGLEGYGCPACHARGVRVRLVPAGEV